MHSSESQTYRVDHHVGRRIGGKSDEDSIRGQHSGGCSHWRKSRRHGRIARYTRCAGYCCRISGALPQSCRLLFRHRIASLDLDALRQRNAGWDDAAGAVRISRFRWNATAYGRHGYGRALPHSPSREGSNDILCLRRGAARLNGCLGAGNIGDD